MDRISRLCGRLQVVVRNLFWVSIIGWSLLIVLFFATPWVRVDDMLDWHTGLNKTSFGARMMVGLFASAVITCYIYAMHQLAELLGLYAQGLVFAQESALRLRKFGLVLLAAPFIDCAMQLGINGVIFLVSRGETSNMQVYFDMAPAIFGLVFTVVAQVMVEATHISDEFNWTV